MRGETDVRQVVRVAKECIGDLFQYENIHSPRLEEVVFDDMKHLWRVTISFAWPSTSVVDAIANKRTFKVVRINDISGNIESVTHRRFEV